MFDARARRHLFTPGPYVATVIALLIAAPHLVWLVRNDFLPFAYADARAVHARGFFDHIYHSLIFLLSQLGVMLPSFFIASPLFRAKTAKLWTGKFNFDFTDETFRIVTLLTWGPTALLIALSAVTGRGLLAMWSYPLCIFAGLAAKYFPFDIVFDS